MSTSSRTGPAEPGGFHVWDLADDSSGWTRRRRTVGWGGPIAATAGVAALAAGLTPALPAELRWCGVIAAGLVAVPVGFSTLRRRLAATSIALALVGVITPFAAGVAVWDATVTTAPVVRNRTVPDAEMYVAEQTPSQNRAFAALPRRDRDEAAAFAAALALRLHTLHGSWGPFPGALQQTQGSLVEMSGPMAGAPLGAVPAGTRIEYDVAASGTAFRITVVSIPHPQASVSMTSDDLQTP